MTCMVFFLEEPSAMEMLKGLLPRILPSEMSFQCIPFEGKQDLEKRLPIRLRAWQAPDTIFVVLRDQDSGDCHKIKASLVAKCQSAGRSDVLVRIACRELEAWYLGDLAAVGRSIGPRNLGGLQEKSKYRSPDRLGNASEELKNIAPDYQKLSGSRAIGPNLSIDGNRSKSFNMFLSGVRELVRRNEK